MAIDTAAHVQWKMTVFKWLVVAAVAVLWIMFDYQKQRSNCQSLKAGRTEGHNRYTVQRDFITFAAERTEKSGVQEAPTDPARAAIDFEYSAKYRKLLTRIHDLPQVSC